MPLRAPDLEITEATVMAAPMAAAASQPSRRDVSSREGVLVLSDMSIPFWIRTARAAGSVGEPVVDSREAITPSTGLSVSATAPAAAIHQTTGKTATATATAGQRQAPRRCPAGRCAIGVVHVDSFIRRAAAGPRPGDHNILDRWRNYFCAKLCQVLAAECQFLGTAVPTLAPGRIRA